MPRRVLPTPPIVLLGVAAAALLANPARAHHLYPDTTQVLLPAGPARIILATNFGLIASDDGVAGWRWQCEHGLGTGGFRYQLAPPPSRRLFTLGTGGVAWSDDLGCSWTAGGSAPDTTAFDFAADPRDPSRLVALAVSGPVGAAANVVLESRDGGATFGAPLYSAPSGQGLSTLAIAPGDPATVYSTLSRIDGAGHSSVVRTSDGGRTWAVSDPGAVTDRGFLWILAVDDRDPARVYFRVAGERREKLAISADGGATVRVALDTGGTIYGFSRLTSGTLLVAAAEPQGRLYRSRDGGNSFAALDATITARGFAERDGKLYAATDNVGDGFALAVSADEGETWKPVMSFADVTTVAPCAEAAAACEDACLQTAMRGVIPQSLCAVGPDAGPAAAPAPPAAGCGCDAAHGGGAPAAALCLVAAALLRRRKRG
jgi:uncharacterized protein (TIGR03382 family)